MTQTINQLVREFEAVLGELPKKPRRYLKRHERAKVPVYDSKGKIVATVLKQCTSVGACKAANVKACEWTFRFGVAGWAIKA